MTRNVNTSCVDWNRGGFDHIGNDLSQEFHIINGIVLVGRGGPLAGKATTCSSIPTGSHSPVPIDSAQGPNDHKVVLLCQFFPPRSPRLLEWTPTEPMQIQHQWSSLSHCFILIFVIISICCGWHVCIITPLVPIVQKIRPHLNAGLFGRYLPKSIGSHIANLCYLSPLLPDPEQRRRTTMKTKRLNHSPPLQYNTLEVVREESLVLSRRTIVSKHELLSFHPKPECDKRSKVTNLVMHAMLQ